MLRKNYLTGKIPLRYILWHEMGHAYTFAYESAEKYWNMDLPQEDAFAYRFWQEVVANFISLKLAIKTDTQIGVPLGLSLKQALEGNARELAYNCSEAYFAGIHASAPKEFNNLVNMMIKKLQEERYWEIDEAWINKVKLQFEHIR